MKSSLAHSTSGGLKDPVRTGPPIRAGFLYPRRVQLYRTHFVQALADLQKILRVCRRVGHQILHALAVHDLVGRTVADLIEVDRQPFGYLTLCGCGAGRHQLFAHGRLDAFIKHPAFTARGKAKSKAR